MAANPSRLDKFFFPHSLMRIRENETDFVFDNFCREQPNTGNETVYIESERRDYIFKAVIFIPKTDELNGLSDHRFLPGESIQVLGDHDELRISEVVKRFEYGNLEENRLWV